MIYYSVIAIVTILLSFDLYHSTAMRQQSRRWQLCIGIILLIAVIWRSYRYAGVFGLDVDEAMGGYNAYALAHYGVDLHLQHYPVYLIAWGAGMNVLYPMLAIPFIKIFGLSLASYRLPMVVLSIIVLFLFVYVLLRMRWKTSYVVLLTALVFLNPWMLMANRWALESNVYPLLMIAYISVLVLYIQALHDGTKTKWLWFVLWNGLLAVSAYAYSNNWLVMAVLVPLLYIYLWRHFKLSLKDILIGLVIEAVIVLPLLLYIVVNFLHHDAFRFFGMTIPKMEAMRSSTQMIFGQEGNLFVNIWHNVTQTLTMFMDGDGMIWNSLPVWGLLYPGMFIFVFIGLVYAIRHLRGQWFNDVMLLSLVAALPVVCFVLPNANHMNAMILPLFYFAMVGLCVVCQTKMITTCTISLGIACFLGFTVSYFHTNKQDLANNDWLIISKEYKKAMHVADTTQRPVVVVDDATNALYIVNLFYHPISPYTFNDEKREPIASLVGTNYMGYGKWSFKRMMTPDLQQDDQSVFIVKKGLSTMYLPQGMKQLYHGKHFVVYAPEGGNH